MMYLRTTPAKISFGHHQLNEEKTHLKICSSVGLFPVIKLWLVKREIISETQPLHWPLYDLVR